MAEHGEEFLRSAPLADSWQEDNEYLSRCGDEAVWQAVELCVVRAWSIGLLAAGAVLAGCGSSQPRSNAPAPTAHGRGVQGLTGAAGRAARAGQPAARRAGRRHFEPRLALAARATRSSSTSGPRGAARARRSSRPSSRRRSKYGRRSRSWASTARTATARRGRFLRRFPVTYPSYTDPQRGDRAHRSTPSTYFPQTMYFDRNGKMRVRPRRPVRERRRAREGHPALRAEMTGTIAYEVRRARGDEEMAAALELRHDGVLRRAGRARARGARRARPRGRCIWWRSPAARCWRPAGCCWSAPTAQFSRLAVRARRAPARDRDRAAGAAPTGDARGRRRAGSCCTPRRTRARCTSGPATSRAGRVFMEAGIEHIAMEKHALSAQLRRRCRSSGSTR